MWIVKNEVMNELLNGDYTMVIKMKKRHCKMSIINLFPFQFTYKSYDGFRKFYNKKLSGIIDSIMFVNDNKFIAKLIKFIMGLGNENR